MQRLVDPIIFRITFNLKKDVRIIDIDYFHYYPIFVIWSNYFITSCPASSSNPLLANSILSYIFERVSFSISAKSEAISLIRLLSSLIYSSYFSIISSFSFFYSLIWVSSFFMSPSCPSTSVISLSISNCSFFSILLYCSVISSTHLSVSSFCYSSSFLSSFSLSLICFSTVRLLSLRSYSRTSFILSSSTPAARTAFIS